MHKTSLFFSIHFLSYSVSAVRMFTNLFSSRLKIIVTYRDTPYSAILWLLKKVMSKKIGFYKKDHVLGSKEMSL